ncbi:MAG: RNA pseudouridine synthase [Bacteroidetes bacterium]|nr:RNA pseudouridine synthase [Bacteroidota bacterium]
MRNEGYTYDDRVGADAAGKSLLAYYAGRYRHSTTAQWQAHICEGRIERNGRVERNPVQTLHAGDRLRWHRPPWVEQDVPTDMPVLWEGSGCIVLHKPEGLPVLPGGGFLRNTLLHIARGHYGPSLSPVHRLGRGTSGAILCSRTTGAARVLAAAMREGSIGKRYLALVAGCDMSDDFIVTTPIGPVPYAPLGTIYAATPEGKPSISSCHVLQRDERENRALLQVDIPTGRPHQIRIHCAAAGYPLAGDPLYQKGGLPLDGNAVPGDCGYHLHSWQLRFPDPDNQKEQSVVAPPPPFLAALLPPACSA